MNKRLVPFLAFVIAFLVFFGAGELLMRLYTWKVVSYDIEMTRYAMEVKEQAGNPSIGHEHRPGAKATLMGVPVSINNDGLRDRDYSVERNAARRYVFLGDSLTMGWGVEQDKSFEALLETRLNARTPTEVLNFGHGNYNPVQEVNLFLEKGLKYKPDEVVLFYFINDAEPTPVVSRWESLGNSRFITFFWSRIKSLASRLDEKQSFQGYYSGLYAEGQPGWTAAKDALLVLKKTCAERNIALKVVLLPELLDPAHYPFAAEHAKVMAFLAQAGIPAFDATPAFKDVTDPHRLWVALDDAHPNAQAHAIIAGATEAFIAGDRSGTEKPH
jgi:lysophospholipase L1-like esterase